MPAFLGTQGTGVVDEVVVVPLDAWWMGVHVEPLATETCMLVALPP